MLPCKHSDLNQKHLAHRLSLRLLVVFLAPCCYAEPSQSPLFLSTPPAPLSTQKTSDSVTSADSPNNPNHCEGRVNTSASAIDTYESSSAAVTTSKTYLTLNTQVFQATFNTSDWSGALKAFNVDSKGALTPAWDAWIPTPDKRMLYTYNPNAAVGSRGIVLQWNNLSKDTDNPAPMPAAQQTYLNTLNGTIDTSQGPLRLDWLRGYSTYEKTTTPDPNNTPVFRKRNHLLGDIVNSDPVFVGTDDYGYGALSDIGDSYRMFRNETHYKNRRPMLYVGANDGMLHGFNASPTEAGKEIFAYLPNALFPELSKLTALDYIHQYYVDSALGVGDVYDGTHWHTLLTGSTGAGGRALFTLDITDPDQFDSRHVLWEFSNFNDADLGYTMEQPSIIRLQSGHWAVITGNGYYSDNGHAVLFVLNALTGAVLQKIDTGVGTSLRKNGLSSPIAVDSNNDQGVDSIYAGDLYGNLWKFDVSASPGSWPTPVSPLFVACTTQSKTCSINDRQAITSKPNIGKVGADQNNTGLMVYFGTGKYFDTHDAVIDAQPQINTFYGLWDQGKTITDRASLQEQTIDYQGVNATQCESGTAGCSATKPARIVSKNTVCYIATSSGCTINSSLKNGWALNLVVKPDNEAQGERVVSFPLVHRDTVIFSTIIPHSEPCIWNGQSFLMTLDAYTGGESVTTALDINGDSSVNEYDKIKIPTPTKNSIEHFAAGIDIGTETTKTPAVIEANDKQVDFKYISGSDGKIAVETTQTSSANNNEATGIRRSWRQLQ